MDDYLLFRLYGPMAAWGETAVGEVRPTSAWPGRSALIGLLGAALGLERTDEAAQEAMVAGYGIAVCVESVGELLRDYHTVQVPPERRGAKALTRRDELLRDGIGTLLSQRDYRADALYVVAVWRRERAPHSLEALAHALREPTFPLYLGRKSCPPALPLAPHVVRAPDIRAAFTQADFPPLPARLAARGDRRTVVWEEGRTAGIDAQQVRRRRDEPLSRPRWQFTEREEFYAEVADPPDTGRNA